MKSGNELHKRRFKKRENIQLFSQDTQVGVKGKAIPVQAWTSPEGSRTLRSSDFEDTRHMKGLTLSALLTGRPFPPGSIPDTHFCE